MRSLVESCGMTVNTCIVRDDSKYMHRAGWQYYTCAMPQSLLIHEALDTAFGGLLKFLLTNFNVSNLAVLREVLVDVLDG